VSITVEEAHEIDNQPISYDTLVSKYKVNYNQYRFNAFQKQFLTMKHKNVPDAPLVNQLEYVSANEFESDEDTNCCNNCQLM